MASKGLKWGKFWAWLWGPEQGGWGRRRGAVADGQRPQPQRSHRRQHRAAAPAGGGGRGLHAAAAAAGGQPPRGERSPGPALPSAGVRSERWFCTRGGGGSRPPPSLSPLCWTKNSPALCPRKMHFFDAWFGRSLRGKMILLLSCFPSPRLLNLPPLRIQMFKFKLFCKLHSTQRERSCSWGNSAQTSA